MIGWGEWSYNQAVTALHSVKVIPAPPGLPVAHTPRSPDPMRWMWRTSMGLGVVGACAMYGLFFGSLSESALVVMVPPCIASIAFGYAGSKSRRSRSPWSRLGVGATGAVAALASLVVFFAVVWPSL